jgi:hypothetical protein
VSAEDDHVGEVFCRGLVVGSLVWWWWGFFGQGFTEDAAGGEDGEDCSNYVGGGGEGEIACVVLHRHSVVSLSKDAGQAEVGKEKALR